MNDNVSINCPDCNTPIFLEVKKLLSGGSFSCVSCNAMIKLSNESFDVAHKSYQAFENLKNNLDD